MATIKRVLGLMLFLAVLAGNPMPGEAQLNAPNGPYRGWCFTSMKEYCFAIQYFSFDLEYFIPDDEPYELLVGGWAGTWFGNSFPSPLPTYETGDVGYWGEFTLGIWTKPVEGCQWEFGSLPMSTASETFNPNGQVFGNTLFSGGAWNQGNPVSSGQCRRFTRLPSAGDITAMRLDGPEGVSLSCNPRAGECYAVPEPNTWMLLLVGVLGLGLGGARRGREPSHEDPPGPTDTP